jgi:NADH-quinone oxidoreductase subunit L
MHASHEVPLWVKWSPFAVMATGLLIAYMAYIRNTDWPQRSSRRHFHVLYDFLLNKWYFDELYNVLFVKPAFAIGRFFWKRGDEGTIDRFGPNGLAALVVAGRARDRAAPVRLSLHLCAGDADRPRRCRNLGDHEHA